VGIPRVLAWVVVILAAVAFVGLVGIGAHELHYASAHPRHPGFSNVIAFSAGAGAVLALAVGLLALGLARTRAGGDEGYSPYSDEDDQ
jgi:hypothetical protein